LQVGKGVGGFTSYQEILITVVPALNIRSSLGNSLPQCSILQHCISTLYIVLLLASISAEVQMTTATSRSMVASLPAVVALATVLLTNVWSPSTK